LCDEVIVLDHGRASYQGKNIAEGVGLYLSLFSGAEETITGSGEVSLKTLNVRSGGDSIDLGETLRVPFGAPLSFAADLQALPALPARAQFLLWNAEMLPVMDVMAEQLSGHRFDFPDSGRATVTATLPATELNAGQYNLSVIVSAPDYDRVYCRHDNAAYIQIDAGTASGAHILSIARWHVMDSPPTENQ
jgi:hypothetical protein